MNKKYHENALSQRLQWKMGHRVTTVSHSGWGTAHTPAPATGSSENFQWKVSTSDQEAGMACSKGNAEGNQCHSIQLQCLSSLSESMFAKPCVLPQSGAEATYIWMVSGSFHAGVIYRS